MKQLNFTPKMILVVSSFIVSGSLYATSATWEFVMQEFAPFNWSENGVPTGPAVEIIQETCKTIDTTCNITVLPWVRAQKETKKGKHHAIFTVGWNNDRDTWLYYTYPLMETEYGLFELKEIENSIGRYKDTSLLHGKRIIVYGPSNTSKRLSRLLKMAQENGYSFVIDQTTRNSVSIKKLMAKRGDLLFSNKDVGEALIADTPEAAEKVVYQGPTDLPYHYYIGFSRNKESNKDNFMKFNSAYGKLVKDGKIEKILEKSQQTLGNYANGTKYTDK